MYRYLVVFLSSLMIILLRTVSPLGAQVSLSQTVWLPLVMKANTNPLHQGIATYYDATGEGACSFDPSPDDLMVAAMNAEEYDNAAVCGAYVHGLAGELLRSELGPSGLLASDLLPILPRAMRRLRE